MINLLLQRNMLQKLSSLLVSHLIQSDEEVSCHRIFGEIPIGNADLQLIADREGEGDISLINQICQ